MRHLLVVCVLVAASGWLPGQCGGNGGFASLLSTPMAIGTTVDVTVGGAGGAPYLGVFSPSSAPTQFSPQGWVCVNLADPGLQFIVQGILPGSGAQTLSVPIPSDPALLSLVAYLQAAVVDPGHPSGLGISPALRIDFENADSYVTTPTLTVARALGTGNAMGDGRVLVAGGGDGSLLSPVGSNSAEVYDPVTRTLSSPLIMNSIRALHTGTTLTDGKVLLAGGIGDVLGNGTASCEVFDGFTNTLTPVAPMNFPRVGHVATLLNDGRVLVVGGIPTFVGGSTNLAAILNAAMANGEVYDPAANTWTLVSNTMSSNRFLPSISTQQNGRALVVSGINGATTFFGQTIPTFTATCNEYDPVTNAFVTAPSLSSGQARAGGSAITMDNGDVLICGGVISGLLGIPQATNNCQRFSGGSWSSAPNMPAAAALPAMVRLRSGNIFIGGGIDGTLLAPTATASAAVFDGTSMLAISPMLSDRGGHVAALMNDGGVFIAGGGDSTSTAQADTWVFISPF